MIIYVIISFFLENTFSLLFNNSNYVPLFFLMSLIVIYQVKNIDIEKYIIYMLCLGLIYDIVYTNIYIDTLLFPILGYANILFKKNINEKILLNSLFVIITILIYELLIYLLFHLISFNNFDIYLYFKMIIKTIPINLIYYLISLFIFKRLR